ncbi:hypothetical protein [Streptomyces luteireticuli]|uniref:hypothetical protein n=1 Tax=Streptomyces luteireticuli TaxID=173858 RepID=UPI00355849C2
MALVMGLLEEREAAARVRVEDLQAEEDRILAELGAVEVVLVRRVIARTELAEALAAPAAAADAPVDVPRLAEAGTTMAAQAAPVAGSAVPRWWQGASSEVLSVDYRRLIELVEAEAVGGEGVPAKELAACLTGLHFSIRTLKLLARRLATSARN